MICIEITVKFLATNPPGIKILIPFYVKVAKALFKIIEIYENIIAENKSYVAESLNNLVGLYENMGDFSEE